jgi:hypothetical protein
MRRAQEGDRHSDEEVIHSDDAGRSLQASTSRMTVS